VTLTDVQAHLQMTAAANAELQRFIDAAETAIGHLTGPLTATATTERHDGGGSTILLKQPRAISLTSVTYADGTTATLSDFEIEGTVGLLCWKYGTAGVFPGGRRFVTVTYSAGFTTLPADLTHAVKELVRHLWETQRGNTSGRPGFADEPVVIGAAHSWPTRVQELIAPYCPARVG